eukprot:jgi/Tetstr1/447046/TSEL_003674.t1
MAMNAASPYAKGAIERLSYPRAEATTPCAPQSVGLRRATETCTGQVHCPEGNSSCRISREPLPGARPADALYRRPAVSGRGGGRLGGMVSLGGAKGRGPGGQVAIKPRVAVPRPVNLPSLRKEHGGNDPSTQLVAPGSAAGWSKQEQGGGSRPGSGGGAVGVGMPGVPPPWQSAGQPGGPPLPEAFSGPNSRAFPPLDANTARLNASDYPTLGAGTKQTGAFASSKPVGGPPGRGAPPGGHNAPRPMPDSRHWSEDERDGRLHPGWREREEQQDERFVGRGLPDDFRGPPRSRFVDDGWDDDLPGMPGFGPPRRAGGPGRAAAWEDPGDDEMLFPGRPSKPLGGGKPLGGPPPPLARRPEPPPEEERDLEREAFLAELERVAADLEAQKVDKGKGDPAEEVPQAAPPPPPPPSAKQPPPAAAPGYPAPAAGMTQAAMLRSQMEGYVPPPPGPPEQGPPPPAGAPPVGYAPGQVMPRQQPGPPPKGMPLATAPPPPGLPGPTPAQAMPPQPPEKTAEERAAEEAERAARQEAIRRRMQEREEEERKRKEAAAAKLRALEDQIAKRAAEKPAPPPEPASPAKATIEAPSEVQPPAHAAATAPPPASAAVAEPPGWQPPAPEAHANGWQQPPPPAPQWSAPAAAPPAPPGPKRSSPPREDGALEPALGAPEPPGQGANMWAMQSGEQAPGAAAPGGSAMAGMSWGSTHGQPGILSGSIFGSGLFANSADGQQTASDAPTGEADKKAPTAAGTPVEALLPGVTSRDAAVKEVGKGGKQLGPRKAIGAPGSAGGGSKPRGSTGNLALQDAPAPGGPPAPLAADDAAIALGGMGAYNWGPNLAGEVMHFAQRQREASAGSSVHLPAHLDPSPAKAPDDDSPGRPDSRASAHSPSPPPPPPPPSGANGPPPDAPADVISDVFGDGVSALPSDLVLEGTVPLEAHHLLGGPGYLSHGGMPPMMAMPGGPYGGYGRMMGGPAPPRSSSPWGHHQSQPHPHHQPHPHQSHPHAHHRHAPPPPPPPGPPQHSAEPGAKGQAPPDAIPPPPQAGAPQPPHDAHMPPQGSMPPPGLPPTSDSFYGSTGYGHVGGGGGTHPLLMGHPSPFTPFGQFGGAPFGGAHFGALGHFGAAGFMPSGKQPDWSNTGQPQHQQQQPRPQQSHPQQPPPPQQPQPPASPAGGAPGRGGAFGSPQLDSSQLHGSPGGHLDMGIPGHGLHHPHGHPHGHRGGYSMPPGPPPPQHMQPPYGMMGAPPGMMPYGVSMPDSHGGVSLPDDVYSDGLAPPPGAATASAAEDGSGGGGRGGRPASARSRSRGSQAPREGAAAAATAAAPAAMEAAATEVAGVPAAPAGASSKRRPIDGSDQRGRLFSTRTMEDSRAAAVC